jgi:hypothetical protein
MQKKSRPLSKPETVAIILCLVDIAAFWSYGPLGILGIALSVGGLTLLTDAGSIGRICIKILAYAWLLLALILLGLLIACNEKGSSSWIIVMLFPLGALLLAIAHSVLAKQLKDQED